jgi:hypothetical protein
MNISTILLEPNDLRSLLRQIIDANPDTVNATDDGGMCVYTDAYNPNRHCLIGQLGWIVPDSEVRDKASRVVNQYNWPVTEEGASYLDNIQAMADGNLQWEEVEL